jgi:hypothetical protein
MSTPFDEYPMNSTVSQFGSVKKSPIGPYSQLASNCSFGFLFRVELPFSALKISGYMSIKFWLVVANRLYFDDINDVLGWLPNREKDLCWLGLFASIHIRGNEWGPSRELPT